jgi:hypothetical protein
LRLKLPRLGEDAQALLAAAIGREQAFAEAEWTGLRLNPYADINSSDFNGIA